MIIDKWLHEDLKLAKIYKMVNDQHPKQKLVINLAASK